MDETQIVAIQMEGLQEYFSVVLFIMLCKVVLTFESVVEMKKPNAIEQLKAIDPYFCCDAVYYTIQGGSNF